MNLKKQPDRVRLMSQARGLNTTEQEVPIVDRDGGDYGSGIVRGVSLIAAGEALGHGMWIDDTMLDQVADQAIGYKHGLKVRFTHPSLSSDGLGKLTARAKNVQRIEGATIADLHLVKSAHNTPEGNLAEYVMDLAENDPDLFGMSIVYQPDGKAEGQFITDNLQLDEDGEGEFVSPSPLNTKNLPHARVSKLNAADVVDEPAANPEGLFYGDEQQAAVEGEALLSYALGLTVDRPEMTCLSVDADRVSQFVTRFLDNHGLTLTKEVTDMSDEIQADAVVEETELSEPVVEEVERPWEGTRFIEAFGEVDGSIYFAKGFSFEDAQIKFTAKLREENERLRQQLSGATAAGEDEPVEFTAREETGPKKRGFEAVVRRAGS